MVIKNVHIQNFKSIVDLSLDLGRFNIFIGENGSGKSNILEAIGFAGAASEGKADSEFLTSRGIRVVPNELISSAFFNKQNDILINCKYEDGERDFKFVYSSQLESWQDESGSKFGTEMLNLLTNIKEYGSEQEILRFLVEDSRTRMISLNYDKIVNANLNDLEKLNQQEHKLNVYLRVFKFLIYSPENTSLRNFADEGQILPLGIKGEGLFKLLKEFIQSKNDILLKEIKEGLEVFDWFEDFEIPSDNFSSENRIRIKDRFLEGNVKYFDQRSANEGFLFMLFYICLFISDKTPSFFAIDNIEASFNPKLCAKVIEILYGLSKKYNKQVIITTHNPAILDGLDLKDLEQKLFVIRRNIDGYTIATSIIEKPERTESMKLSEMWTKGFLGGLPKNF